MKTPTTNPSVIPLLPGDILDLAESPLIKQVRLHTRKDKAVIMITAIYAREVGKEFDLAKFSEFLEVPHEDITAILSSLISHADLLDGGLG